MQPTLNNGETWLALATNKGVKPGAIIVFRHPQRELLTDVKRVIRWENDGWWVEGDNAENSTDSRHFGVIAQSAVTGRLIKKLTN